MVFKKPEYLNSWLEDMDSVGQSRKFVKPVGLDVKLDFETQLLSPLIKQGHSSLHIKLSPYLYI